MAANAYDKQLSCFSESKVLNDTSSLAGSKVVNVTLLTYASGCRYWDTHIEAMSSEGCEVSTLEFWLNFPQPVKSVDFGSKPALDQSLACGFFFYNKE